MFKQLRNCGCHVSMCCFKTYVNSWCVSYRYHEERFLPCIFSYTGAKDLLQHYVSCERLWRLLHRVTKLKHQLNVLERIGLLKPSRSTFCRLAVAFTVYHGVKIGEREVVTNALASGRFGPLAKIAHNFADSAHRSFSSSLN